MISRRLNPDKMNRQEIMFAVAWMMFCIALIFNCTTLAVTTDSNVIYYLLKILRYGSYALCLAAVCMGKLKKREVVQLLILLVLFLAGYIGSRDMKYLLYFFFLAAAFFIRDTEIMRIAAVVQAAYLIICVGISQLFPDWDYIFVQSGERYRHSLGFSYTTFAPILYFYFLLSYIYLRKEKFTWIEAVILEAINLWLYKMTDTRMAFLLSTLFLLFFCLVRYQKKWRIVRRLKYLFYALPTVICVLAIYINAAYSESNAFLVKLNSMISNRLILGHNAYSEMGLNLFGHQVEWIGFSITSEYQTLESGYNYVDCSYMQLALEFGLLFLCAVIIIYTIAVVRSIKSGNYYLTYIIIIVLFFAITEPRLMNFAFNPFPLMAFCRYTTEKEVSKKRGTPAFFDRFIL